MPATDTGETNQKKRTKPQHTSQRCSKCSSVDPGNRVSQAIFRCLSCGHQTNADINAAENIRHQGLEILAKPESTERMRGGWIRKGREAWVMVQCPDAAGFERVRVETAMPGGC